MTEPVGKRVHTVNMDLEDKKVKRHLWTGWKSDLPADDEFPS